MKNVISWLGVLAPFLIATGGVMYAITSQMGTVTLVFIWVGLLLLVFSFYINFSKIVELLYKRSARYSANMALVVGVFAVIIWMLAAMSVKYKWRVDFTETKRYTLSPQTVKVLKGLDKDVEAIAFYRSDERTRQSMYDLLEEFSYYSPNFTFWFVDPDRQPFEAAKYEITSYRTTLLRSGGKQEIVGFESEVKMINALVKVIRNKAKVIYFLKGHGENAINGTEKVGYKAASDAMRKENYQVRELQLMSMENVPDDASLIVVSGPKVDLLEEELYKITRYIDKGGSALFLLDPGNIPALTNYLNSYGFTIGKDIVIDKLGKLFGTNYLTPVVSDYHKQHPLTKEFNIATFFPLARSVEIKDEPEKGNYTLAKTSQGSWAVAGVSSLEDESVVFNPEKDKKGPLGVVAVRVVEANVDLFENINTQETPEESLKKWGRILIVGDSDFANNTNINLAGNKDFFLNMINWLNEETDLVSIRKKESGITPLLLTETQGNLVFWLSIIVMPSLIATLGFAVVVRRRMGD